MNTDVIGVDFQLEPDGSLDLKAIAPAVRLLFMRMMQLGFDETASVRGEVKNGRFELTVSMPPAEIHSIMQAALAGKKPGEA